MYKYSIVSDSACDLPEELRLKLGVDIVPFYVTLDEGKSYQREVLDIPVDEFYKRIMSEGIYPRTSLPSIQDYVDEFEKHMEQGRDVICLCLSKKFSGSYQSAQNAAEMLRGKYPELKVYIIDTMLATASQGLLAAEASRIREAGLSVLEAVDVINSLRATARINFTVDDLSYLEHGGRIGRAGALAGAILNIKPIITLREGELMPEKKARGRKKAIRELIDMTLAELAGKEDEYKVCVIHVDREAEAENIMNELEGHGLDVYRGRIYIGATIGAHAGPTAIGVCYIKKFVRP